LTIPDPRWLEILKASGWQTAAVAGACALFLLIAHWGWLPPLEPWMIQLAAIATLICGFLALASFISTTLRFFPVQTWVLHWISRHRAKRAVRDYIPHMTDREKQIIGYLLAKNQKMFSAESDGGFAAPLLSRGNRHRCGTPRSACFDARCVDGNPGSRLGCTREAQRSVPL
jgi:hypothetical protein